MIRRYWVSIFVFAAWLSFLVCVALDVHARDPRFIPSFDLQSEYVSGGGVVYGNLYMRGNDIYLDADDNSRFELGTDDRFQVYLNSSLIWNLDEFGLEQTMVAITESGNDDRALYINPVLNDTGAPDGTEAYVAVKVDITETDKTGWNSVDLLVLSVDTTTVLRVDDAGALYGANGEKLDNATDGSWRMTGVGGTYNEDLEFDLEGDNLVELKSSTGVTTIDAGAIGLACGTLDVSDGNITNAGDIQADSITADGTALQTNSSTLVLQQNADVASGGFATFNSETDAELTASSGSQSFLIVAPEILQTGTAGYTALEVDATESSVGSGNNSLLDLQVADASKLRVDTNGKMHGANAETLDNGTDGSWRMTGVGGTYNEDLEFDLEGDNLVELKSSTGVTTIDTGAIGLACGTADLSDGNLTNAGDVQADSITADGTALQTNASTLTLQQNADLASGNHLTINSETDAELTAASGAQSFVQVAPEIDQSGTAGYTVLEVDVAETGTGSGNKYLLDLQVGDASKFSVDNTGAIVMGGGLSLGGNLDMNGNDIVEVDSVGGNNSETFDNSTDGSWRMTGVGGTYNEDLEFDLEGDNLVELKSSTGVTTIDAGAIGLACGTADLSDGNLTNAGDIQADSITADGTALQTNASTLTLQQNADLASGNHLTIDSETDAELTAASGAQSFVQVAPEIDQSGTAGYTALEVDVTETGTGSGNKYLLDLQVGDASKFSVDNTGAIVMGGGLSLGGNLDMNGNDIVEVDSVGGNNSETFDNSTDGSWRMTGVGGTYNEDLEFDLEGDNLVELKSSTGVTTIDAGAIGLACGTVDLSDGNLTNAGDVQADSITADGTALQTNASTLTLQQNADVSSGNYLTIDSETDAELTASSGVQSFVQIAPEIAQTGTAGYTALEIDVTETSEGSVTDYLLDLQVADASKMSVDSDGALVCATTGDFGGNLTLDQAGTNVNSPILSLKGDSGGTEVEGQIMLAYGADPYIRISVDDDDSTPAMTGVLDIHDSALSFVNDNTTDIGASGANRPKNYYGAGSITCGGSMSCVGGDFGDGNITNVGDIALDSITADGSQIDVASQMAMQGNDLLLDADDDSRWEHGTDDQLQLYLNSGLVATFVSAGNLGIGEDVPLGKLHIKTADSGGSVPAAYDEVVVEGSGSSGITVLSGTSSNGAIAFADSGGTTRGAVYYAHNTDLLYMYANGANTATFSSTDLELVNSGAFQWSSSTAMSAPSDGNLLLTDTAGTSFTSLKLGGTTSSFPALVRTADDLEIKKADLSGRAGVIALDYSISNSGFVGWIGRSLQYSPADGNIRLSNNAIDDFGLLQLGGTTSSYPALKRSDSDTDALEARLADDSARAVLQAASITVDTYTIGIEIPAGSAILGPSAPSWAETTSQTVGGLLFDADAEEVFLQFEVPSCWIGTTDLTLKIYWTNQAGAAVGNTETVKFDITYGSIVWGTEAAGNGTEETGTVTYTSTGDADGDTFISEIALDYDSTDQPINVGDDLTIHFDRDVGGDTYASGALVAKFEIEFDANGICDHY